MPSFFSAAWATENWRSCRSGPGDVCPMQTAWKTVSLAQLIGRCCQFGSDKSEGWWYGVTSRSSQCHARFEDFWVRVAGSLPLGNIWLILRREAVPRQDQCCSLNRFKCTQEKLFFLFPYFPNGHRSQEAIKPTHPCWEQLGFSVFFGLFLFWFLSFFVLILEVCLFIYWFISAGGVNLVIFIGFVVSWWELFCKQNF